MLHKLESVRDTGATLQRSTVDTGVNSSRAEAAHAEAQRRLDHWLRSVKAWSAWELAQWARLYPSTADILARADAGCPAGTLAKDWQSSDTRVSIALAIVGFELEVPEPEPAPEPAAVSTRFSAKASAVEKRRERAAKKRELQRLKETMPKKPRLVARPIGAPTNCAECFKVNGDTLLELLRKITAETNDGAHGILPLYTFLKPRDPFAAAAAQRAAAALLCRLAELGVPSCGVWRAVHAAAASGSSLLLDELLAVAQTRCANPTRTLLTVPYNGTAGRHAATPLETALRARSREGVKWLCTAARACGIAVAASVEAAASDISTLHIALEMSRGESPADVSDLISSLLATGASLSRKNEYNAAPLHVAVQAGSIPAVRAIVSHAGLAAVNLLSESDAKNRTPVHIAAEEGSEHVMGAILTHVSTTACYAATVSLLLKTDPLSRTPLHIVIAKKCVTAVRSILSHFAEDTSSVRKLLLAKDDLGRTPLHLALVVAGARAYTVEAKDALAAEERRLERLRSSKSGDLAAVVDSMRSLRDLSQRCAAECAAGETAAATEVVTLLLSTPGCLDALRVQDRAGRRPLHVASLGPLPAQIGGAFATALMKLPHDKLQVAVTGCALHALARVKDGAALLRTVLGLGAAAADARDTNGMVALHFAFGCDNSAMLLAAHSSSLNAQDNWGRTPLYCRAATNDPGSVEVLLAAPGVLVEGGEARAHDGRLPLGVAGAHTAPLLHAHSAAVAARAEAARAAAKQRRAAAAAAASLPANAAAALLDEDSVTLDAPSSAADGDAASEEAWAREAKRMRAALAPDLDALRAAAAGSHTEAVLPAVPSPLARQAPVPNAAGSDAGSLTELEGCFWELQCTHEVRDAIAAQQPDLRKRTLRVLRKLAEGDWDAADFLSSEGGLLYKVAISHHSASGLRLLLQRAVDFSPRHSGYVECVRLWALVKHDAFDRALAATQESLRRGGRAAVRLFLNPRTAASPRRGKCILPRTFVRVDDAAAEETLVYTPPVDLSRPAEPLLRVFIDFSNELAAALLRSASAAAACEWPAHLDEAEAKLVYKEPFSEPLLLLGRSGTGKTMVMVHRMWRLYRQHGVKRFVFVTASAVLRDRVRTLFRRMMRGVGGNVARATDCADALDAAGGPRSLVGAPSEAWPLFLTNSELLCLLDGASEKPFFPRASDGALLRPQHAPAAWRPGGEAAASAAAADAEQPDVDFRVFQRSFWPSLVSARPVTHRGAAGFIPREAAAAVWREFISFIKAGAHADLASVGMPLSRAQYIALPAKVASSFAGSEQRSAVYDMFEHYEKLKKARNTYDAADLVCHIARAQSKRPLGAGPHALAHAFVDEVQDLTQAELLLLVKTLQRPGGGLFLAGDTAQAITAGVGFRFEDTKALLYRAGGEGAGAGVPPRWGKPELHWLTVNYRAQSGLVDCAAAVGELLVKLFPGSVDALPRERGLFRGRRPVLERATDAVDIEAKFVPPDARGDAVSAFGARQAVLVRSDAARRRLARDQPWLNERGAIILTVEESKGAFACSALLRGAFSYFPFGRTKLQAWNTTTFSSSTSFATLSATPSGWWLRTLR